MLNPSRVVTVREFLKKQRIVNPKRVYEIVMYDKMIYENEIYSKRIYENLRKGL